MRRHLLSLAIVASAADMTGSSSVQSIGDVLSEGLRGAPSPQHHRSLNGNVDVLAHMLGKEHFDSERDECLVHVHAGNDTAVYGRCDIRRFPYCHGDRPNICFNRINRQDAFYPDKHPKYYIDYNRVHCYPDRMYNDDFTCSSCSPGRWCMPEGRCILDEKRYHCWDI